MTGSVPGRVLTTHVGSLGRPLLLGQAVIDRSLGRSTETDRLSAWIEDEIAKVVRRQVECGLDLVNDGEYSKPGFVNYINERLTGFAPQPAPPTESYWLRTRDAKGFPEYYDWLAEQAGVGANSVGELQWNCTGPISYAGHDLVRRDIATLARATQGTGVVGAFMSSIACTTVEGWNKNYHYPTDLDYLYAIAEAMREEYALIIEAGLILQIDDPDLATYYVMHPDKSVEECRRWARERVEAVNHSLRGLPRDRVRYHTCYSINAGPRVHDMDLKDIVDIMLEVKAGGFSFEAANPRHEHEWTVWQDRTLPDGAVLIPGVITHSSSVVEHPELVAQRIVRFADLVGRDRVIAGADCGFASLATSAEIHPTIVWAKLTALADGARIASRRLWPGA